MQKLPHSTFVHAYKRRSITAPSKIPRYRKNYRECETGTNTEEPSSKTGLSIENEDVGGGDRDFFMLVNRRIRLTLLFSFFSFA